MNRRVAEDAVLLLCEGSCKERGKPAMTEHTGPRRVKVAHADGATSGIKLMFACKTCAVERMWGYEAP